MPITKLAEDWIRNAVEKPGSLRDRAKKEGAITENGTIDKKWLQEKAKGNDLWARRAKLALTFCRMRNYQE